MECGIVGFQAVGKPTLFKALTAHAIEVQAGSMAPNVGQAEIPDPRLDQIAGVITTRKIIPAKVQLVDIPGVPSGGGASHGSILANIRNVDALCHVVNCFDGVTDARSACQDLLTELALSDLVLVESSLDKATRAARGGDKEAAARRDVLERCKGVLEDEKPLRSATWNEQEQAILRSYGMLSSKPQLVVANISETDIERTDQVATELSEFIADQDELIVLCAELESQIAELPPDDRDEMLSSMGLQEPAIGPLARAINTLLGLGAFYTAGEKEVRSWIIRQGSSAPEAAGSVHSDIERGFIRAECYHVDELLELGSEKAIKSAGKLRSEGKQYIMQDGDVVHFLFNV